MARTEGRFGAALGVTLWLVGLLVAIMTGMLSAYLVLTALWIGSRVWAHLLAVARRPALRGGESD